MRKGYTYNAKGEKSCSGCQHCTNSVCTDIRVKISSDNKTPEGCKQGTMVPSDDALKIMAGLM